MNEKSAKDDDDVEILEEGMIEVKQNAETKKDYKVLNLPVLLNGKHKLIYSPNTDAISVLQKAFGMDTKDWKGKKFKIKTYPKLSFGVTKTAIMPVIKK